MRVVAVVVAFVLTVPAFAQWTSGTGVQSTNDDVGINTNAPGAPLHVASNSGDGSQVDLIVNGRIRTGDANNHGGIWLNSATTTFLGLSDSSGAAYGFYSNAWRMLIGTNTGNIGVNTSPTSYRFDVNGSTHTTSLAVDDSVAIGATPLTLTRLRLAHPGSDTASASANFLMSFGKPSGQFWFFRNDTSNRLHLDRQYNGIWGFVSFDPQGYMGINNQTPQFPLDLAGDASRSVLKISATTPFATPPPAGVGALSGTVVAADNVTLGFDSDLVGGGFIARSGTIALLRKQSGHLQILASTGNTNGQPIIPAATVFDADLATGLVGIGGAAGTTERLRVHGNVHATGDVTAGGTIYAKYQDVAEWVPAIGEVPAGTVVILNPNANNEVMPSHRAYDTTVAGVVSAQPGLLLGVPGESKAQVATTGRVKVRVDASRGAIAVGDLLVTSDKPGTAMKSTPVDLSGIAIHRPGTLIGKALEPLADGEGEILVLLSLQ